MYTLKHIAQKLDIAPATVRYYKDNYKEFLPDEKVEGKQHPLYEDTALEIIKFVSEQTKRNRSRVDIKKDLAKKHAPIFEARDGEEKKNREISTKQRSNNPSAVIPEQYAAAVIESTKFTHHLLLEIRDQNELLEKKDKRIEALKEMEEENEEMKKEIARLRAMPFWERWRAS